MKKSGASVMVWQVGDAVLTCASFTEDDRKMRRANMHSKCVVVLRHYIPGLFITASHNGFRCFCA